MLLIVFRWKVKSLQNEQFKSLGRMAKFAFSQQPKGNVHILLKNTEMNV